MKTPFALAIFLVSSMGLASEVECTLHTKTPNRSSKTTITVPFKELHSRPIEDFVLGVTMFANTWDEHGEKYVDLRLFSDDQNEIPAVTFETFERVPLSLNRAPAEKQWLINDYTVVRARCVLKGFHFARHW